MIYPNKRGYFLYSSLIIKVSKLNNFLINQKEVKTEIILNIKYSCLSALLKKTRGIYNPNPSTIPTRLLMRISFENSIVLKTKKIPIRLVLMFRSYFINLPKEADKDFSEHFRIA